MSSPLIINYDAPERKLLTDLGIIEQTIFGLYPPTLAASSKGIAQASRLIMRFINAYTPLDPFCGIYIYTIGLEDVPQNYVDTWMEQLETRGYTVTYNAVVPPSMDVEF